ncbi:MFS transporter [Streptomyces sp. NPDC101234]|uniref:MFS transporter n=1 Tax=Streptomyces sp. NPDC101234 TaxID=3366138 RepID=UPI003803B6E3
MSHALSRTVDDGESAAPRTNAVVAALAFGGIVFSLMQSLVIPIVPELPKLLDTSSSNSSWAVTATLLAAAVATPVTGRLGDMIGKRRMILVSLVMLMAGSITAALSDSLTPMIVGRALQGLAAGVVPLGISIMRDELPPERLGSATALMSASLGVGGAFGLPAAAAIAEHFDWHTLFWSSAAAGAVATVLVLLFVPESKIRTGGRFDVVGAIGMAAGLVSLLLAVSKGADWGWTSGTTLGLFAAAVVILLLWGVFELRVKEPLVDLRTTARRQVLFTNFASIAVGFGMFTMMLVIPQLMQLPTATGYGLGKSLLTAGLVMAPMGAVMMATAPISALVSRARGPRTTLMIGALIVAAGYGLNIMLMDEVWHFVLVASVIGAGIGFTFGAMPALIMGAVPASETGAANSLNTLMRSIGTSTASAVAAVILSQMTNTVGITALPSENGFKTVMVVGAGAGLLAFALASFIPRHRPAVAPDAAAEGATTEPSAASAASDPAAAPATVNGSPVTTPQTATVRSARVVTPTVATVVSGGIPVGGHVHGAEKAPVARAAVTLISLEGRQLSRSVARADGSYGVDAPGAGSYVLIASADGYQPQATTVVVSGEPVTYDILLSGTSALAGVVRSSDSGNPVAAAAVIVTDVRGDVLASEQTDSFGEFSVADLVPGPVTLAITSPKYRPLAQLVEIGATGITRMEVELHPGAHLRGTVRGAGVPLGDASVTLVDTAGNVVATTRTGSDGAYAFSDLGSGTYAVIATGYPPRTAEVAVSEGDVDGLDLELAHTGE